MTLQQKYNELSIAFNDAEEALKTLGTHFNWVVEDLGDEEEIEDEEGTGKFVSGLLFPAVNQLRYAGKHLSDAVVADDESSAIAEVEKAIRHCHRAEYDAYDALVLYFIVGLGSFKETYGGIPKSPHINGYSDDLELINSIQDEIQTERRGNRREYFSRKREQVDQLATIFRKWDAAREELDIIRVSAWRKDMQRWIAIIAAVVFGVLAWLK